MKRRHILKSPNNLLTLLLKTVINKAINSLQREIAEKMGVSRNAVREALGTLQTLNIISSRPGSGTYVENPPNTDELGSLIFPVLEESESPVVVFQARAIFEAGVVEEAISSLKNKDYEWLEGILSEMKKSLRLGNYEEAYEENSRFHLFITESVKNPIVKSTMIRLWKTTHSELLRQAVLSYWQDNTEEAIECHRNIIEAMKGKDSNLATELVKSHYNKPKEHFLKTHEHQGGD